jgi:hypothetical protein
MLGREGNGHHCFGADPPAKAGEVLPNGQRTEMNAKSSLDGDHDSSTEADKKKRTTTPAAAYQQQQQQNFTYYHDYSRSKSATPSLTDAVARLSPPPRTASPLRVHKLPSKLNAMLSDPEFNSIISWMPHGRSWKVHNAHLFLEQVIPRFFEYTNYNSFIRLVNAWGFRRILKGPDRNSYYHEVSSILLSVIDTTR